MHDKQPTIGELFAGIGGFSLGFERAGWRTAWQVELDAIKRAVLGDRFPNARQFEDVNRVGAKELFSVDCIAAGFPCTDISNMGAARKGGKQGLRGERSGLFWEVIRIAGELQPRWLVLENVPALLHSNDCEDFEAVVKALADGGYVGFWRVLDAQYFGVAQKRRRIFLVAGLGEMPPFGLLADAAPVEALPNTFMPGEKSWGAADSWAGYTHLAIKNGGQIPLGGPNLVAEQGRWDQMVERERTAEQNGIRLGSGEADLIESRCAGDAVCPQITEWIGRHLSETFTGGGR